MTPYDPQMTCYPYTDKTDGHYLVVKKNDGQVFDNHYTYVDDSFSFKFKRFLMKVGTTLLAMPLMRIRTLLKIKGRKNLRKNKDIIKQGVVSVVNHVHMWDFIGVMNAVLPYVPYIPVWDKNMRGENKTLIKYNNGIALPTDNLGGTVAFAHAINKLLQRGEWVHFSVEGSMWEYYQPIRPFKRGAFTFAVRNNKPIIPMAFSYRKPKGIAKLFWKKPLLNLAIGEPIFPDMTLSKSEATDKLLLESHQAVCRLAGINPQDNIYQPAFCDSDRIDYYPLNKPEQSTQ